MAQARTRKGCTVICEMFDDETERLAPETGLEMVLATADLGQRLDSKIETTRIGNEAGVPGVPNTIGRGALGVGL